MKYRTDFVTNSSSSSSVVIFIRKGSVNETIISLHEGIFLESLGDSCTSYQKILERLADFKMMEIIENRDIPQRGDQWLVEISGAGDVYLPEDRINQFKQTHPTSPLIKELDLLKSIEKSKATKANDYSGFVNHPLWSLMGVKDSSKITKIIENFDLSGDYNENKVTEINPKNLKVEVEILSSDDMDESENEDNDDE